MGAKPEKNLTVENSENGINLYKISESGLEELSIVESEDLYGSEDNLQQTRYDAILQDRMDEAKLYRR